MRRCGESSSDGPTSSRVFFKSFIWLGSKTWLIDQNSRKRISQANNISNIRSVRKQKNSSGAPAILRVDSVHALTVPGDIDCFRDSGVGCDRASPDIRDQQ